MSNLQIHDANVLSRRGGTTATPPNAFFQHGDAVTITDDVEVEAAPQVNHREVRNHTFQVIAAETWQYGQAVYWQEAGAVFTTQRTDAFVGFAQRNAPDLVNIDNLAKRAGEASGWVTCIGQPRANGVTIDVDFALQPSLGLILGGPNLDGRYLLRDYSASPTPTAWFDEAVITYFGTLAGATATIQLGDLADPDKYLTATAFSVISAGGVQGERVTYALAAAAVSGSDVYLTVSVADATGGRLVIDLVATH